VTQYLNPAAVTEKLQQLGRFCGSGSDLVVQFIAPASYLNAEEAEILQALASAAVKIGEPWLSFFEPAEMEREVHRAGFGGIVHYGPDEPYDQYLRGRTDRRRVPAYFRMIRASVQ
jgi:O-methyltransferase involved in polyketide biosynthesis